MKEKKGWDHVANWYDKLVGEIGHYYHKHVVIPNVLRILKGQKSGSLLDLGCGQGVLERVLPEGIAYCGVDISKDLIKDAKARSKRSNSSFIIGDITSELELSPTSFTSAALILAVQDIDDVEKVFQNAAKYLESDGTFIIVMNHPYYRIPRQSSWGIDPEKKIQFRRIDRYLTPLQVPIQTSPGKGVKSETVYHYHQPLSFYSRLLNKTGFTIELIDEWVSNKTSTGTNAKMENRAREEFPLFLCLICRKT